MPDSKAQQIIDALTVTVGGLSIIKESGNRNRHWNDVDNTPAAFVVYGGEAKVPGPTVSMTSVMSVVIQTLHHTEDPDREFMDIARLISDVVAADPSIGGLADSAWVSNTSPLLTSEEIASEDLFIGEVTVSVEYRHVRGTA